MRKNAFFTCILAAIFTCMKRNVALFGFAFGIVLPIIGLVLEYFAFKSVFSNFGDYINTIFNNPRTGFQLISLSLLMNLIPFLYFSNKRLDLSLKGVVIATMLYAVLAVLIKFVWN